LREKRGLASSIKAEFVGNSVEGGGAGSEGGNDAGLSKKDQILKEKQARQEQEEKKRKEELAQAARENAGVRNQAKQRQQEFLHGDPGQPVPSPAARMKPFPPQTEAGGGQVSPRKQQDVAANGAKKVHFCIEAGSPLSEEIMAQLTRDEDKAAAESIKRMEGEFTDTCERQHHLQV